VNSVGSCTRMPCSARHFSHDMVAAPGWQLLLVGEHQILAHPLDDLSMLHLICVTSLSKLLTIGCLNKNLCDARLACARLGHLSTSQCRKLSLPSTRGFIVAGVTFRLTPVRLRRARFASISSGLQPRVAPLLTLLRFWWMADGRKPPSYVRALNGTGCAR
jgi:hypothetical protein